MTKTTRDIVLTFPITPFTSQFMRSNTEQFIFMIYQIGIHTIKLKLGLYGEAY